MKAPDFIAFLGTSRQVNYVGKSFTSSYIFMTSLSPDLGASFKILRLAIQKLFIICSLSSECENWVSY